MANFCISELVTLKYTARVVQRILMTDDQLQSRVSACIDEVASWMQANQLQLNLGVNSNCSHGV